MDNIIPSPQEPINLGEIAVGSQVCIGLANVDDVAVLTFGGFSVTVRLGDPPMNRWFPVLVRGVNMVTVVLDNTGYGAYGMDFTIWNEAKQLLLEQRPRGYQDPPSGPAPEAPAQLRIQAYFTGI